MRFDGDSNVTWESERQAKKQSGQSLSTAAGIQIARRDEHPDSILGGIWLNFDPGSKVSAASELQSKKQNFSMV
jgi:hypothetical protein